MAGIRDRLLASPWLPRLMVVLAIGACMNLAGLAVALVLIQGQARAGQMAREVQLRRQPVSSKLYEEAWRRGVISYEDLMCFRDLSKCPEPTATPARP